MMAGLHEAMVLIARRQMLLVYSIMYGLMMDMIRLSYNIERWN